MEEEKLKVLEMLSEGKITADEADQLLDALEAGAGHSSPPPESPVQKHKGWLDWILSWFGPKATYQEELDWTLDGNHLALINAQAVNGSISFTGSDQDQVTIHARKEVHARTQVDAEALAQQVHIRAERQGDEIRIDYEHPHLPPGVNIAVHYEIQGPKTAPLQLRTHNGKVRIDDSNAPVEATTTNGTIQLRGGADQVHLRTVNGLIEMHEAAGEIHAHAKNGYIRAQVERLQSAGAFSTSNGSIEVEIEQGAAPLTATAVNGAIELTLPADFSGQLDARAVHGRVRSELPVSVTRGARNRLVGSIGQGGETLVRLRTINGSIRVMKQ